MKYIFAIFLIILILLPIQGSASEWFAGNDSYTRLDTNPILPLRFGYLFEENGTYYAFSQDATSTNLFLYSSTDLIEWTYIKTALSVGSGGSWDDAGILTPSIIKRGTNDYIMFYQGRASAEGDEQVGLANATSITGTWTKNASNPIYNDPTFPFGATDTEIFGAYKYNSTHYIIWYNSLAEAPRRTHAAISSDLTTWTRGDGGTTPIFNNSGTDYENRHFMPMPFTYNSVYYLFMTQQNTSNDYAKFYLYNESTNADIWFKNTTRELSGVPFSYNQGTGYMNLWDARDLDCPSVIINNYSVILFYSGIDSGDINWYQGISYLINRTANNQTQWGLGTIETWDGWNTTNVIKSKWKVYPKQNNSLDVLSISTTGAETGATENAEVHRNDSVGNTFTTTSTLISNVSFYQGVTGTGIPSMHAVLYSTKNGVPFNRIYQTPDQNVTNNAWINFTLNTPVLNNTLYYIGTEFNVSGGVLNATTYLNRLGNSANPYSGGVFTYSSDVTSFTWSNNSAWDVAFRVYFSNYTNSSITNVSDALTGNTWTTANINISIPTGTAAFYKYGLGADANPAISTTVNLTNGSNSISLVGSGRNISQQIDLNSSLSTPVRLDNISIIYAASGEETPSNTSPIISSWSNTKTNNQTLNFTINITESVTFNVTANQTITTWNWTRNDYEEVNNFDNYTHQFLASNRTVNISVRGNNSNGTTQFINWSVYVNDNGSYIPPVLSPSFIPMDNEVVSGFTELANVENHLNWSEGFTEQWNETAGSSNKYIRYSINSSAVTNASGLFNLTTRAMYNGNPAHFITVRMYNFSTSLYEEISNATYRYNSSTGFMFRNWTGLSNTHYRNATGITIVSFNHSMAGISSHKLFIDELKITLDTTPAPLITSWSNNYTNNATLFLWVNTTDTVRFNVTANQYMNGTAWAWYSDDYGYLLNGDNHTHQFLASNRTINISVNGTNSNGTTQTIRWEVNVTNNGSYIPPVIFPSFIPYDDVMTGFTEFMSAEFYLNYSERITEVFNETSGGGDHFVDYYFNSSSVTNASGLFNITTAIYYRGQSPDDINITVWNFTSTTADRSCGTITQYTDFEFNNCTHVNNSHYRNASGVSIVRINHLEGGKNNHRLFVDEMKITLETNITLGNNPNITAWANNINGSNQTTMIMNVSNNVTFNVTVNQTVTAVSWKVNGTEFQNTSSLSYFSWFNATGYYNVTAQAFNANGSSQIVYTNVSVVEGGAAPPCCGGGGDDWDWARGYVKYPNGTGIEGVLVTTSAGTANTGAGGYFSFGYVFIHGNSYSFNGTKSGYDYNATTYAFSSGDWTWANLTMNVSAVPPVYNPPNVTDQGNNLTNNNTLTFFTEKYVTIGFNISANQTLTGCTWTGATQQNCTNAYNNFTLGGINTVTYQGTNANGSTQVITWTVTVNSSTNLMLNGYITNVLTVPLQNARVDINGTFDLTDVNGYYSIPNLTEGTYTVLARQIGYKNNSVLYFINDSAPLNFTMNEKGSVVSAPGFDMAGVLIVTLFMLLRRKK